MRIAYERSPSRTFGLYWRALRHEWRRILAWRHRYNPATGRNHGTLDAWAVVIENPPTLDATWDATDWIAGVGPDDEVEVYDEDEGFDEEPSDPNEWGEDPDDLDDVWRGRRLP